MDNDELLAVLRGDIAGINQRIDDTRLDLGARIDEVKVDLGVRIDDVKSALEGKINDTKSALEGKIEDTEWALDGKIEDTKWALVAQIKDNGTKIEDVKSDLVVRIDETNRRIDAVAQFKLQGAALVVALAATTAVVGTFVRQVLAAFLGGSRSCARLAFSPRAVMVYGRCAGGGRRWSTPRSRLNSKTTSPY